MYAFILLQENIFRSYEYSKFTHSSLSELLDLSLIKSEALEYLINNRKLQKMMKNEKEKDILMHKLAKVNKQLK
jgi:hypothetical protein